MKKRRSGRGSVKKKADARSQIKGQRTNERRKERTKERTNKNSLAAIHGATSQLVCFHLLLFAAVIIFLPSDVCVEVFSYDPRSTTLVDPRSLADRFFLSTSSFVFALPLRYCQKEKDTMRRRKSMIECPYHEEIGGESLGVLLRLGLGRHGYERVGRGKGGTNENQHFRHIYPSFPKTTPVREQHLRFLGQNFAYNKPHFLVHLQRHTDIVKGTG